MTEDQFNQLLEQNNATLFGQISQYFDRRFDSLRDELKSDNNRIYTSIDGIAKRLETDEQERAAMNEEQKRRTDGSASSPKLQILSSSLSSSYKYTC